MTEASKPTIYCCGFYFDEAAFRVLLIQKLRPAWMKGLFNGIGGHVEHGETVHQAMTREFAEETGVKVSVDRWVNFAQLNGGGFKVVFFRANRHDGDAEPTSKTDEPIEWFRLDCLPKQRVSNIPWLLAMADPKSAHDWPYRVDERWTNNPEDGDLAVKAVVEAAVRDVVAVTNQIVQESGIIVDVWDKTPSECRMCGESGGVEWQTIGDSMDERSRCTKCGGTWCQDGEDG